ncbi:MAG: MauE/DoxX family redox-associated membrane protein [Gaiella sp.]
MATLVLVARLILAGVFAVAAITKLVDREGTRKAVAAFGAPARIAAALAIVLPLAELAVAALLLPSSTASVGALGALVLLGTFTAAIAWNLAHGRAPDCHCFGQLHSAPASWKTLARNAVLLALAASALAGILAEPPASAIAWIGDLNGAELLALAVAVSAAGLVGVGAVGFVTLMRSYGSVLVRLDRLERALADEGIDPDGGAAMPELGLEPGTPAPAFRTVALSGETVSLETLTSTGLPSLLLFTSPTCGPCKVLLPAAAAWQREHADELTVVFASDGSREEVRAEAEELGLRHVVLDEDRRLSESYLANGTPSAVLISPDGSIGSWVASGAEWIEQLVAQALAGKDDGGLPLGAEAPALELPTLDGEAVSLESLRGRDALLLFWNPDCGFCRSMRDDVLAWEGSANGVTPRLVVVSSGDAERTRAEGFRSLVLLDEDFAAGSAFNANGTPMGVLVDADGRVASPVAAGAEAVLALANGRS